MKALLASLAVLAVLALAPAARASADCASCNSLSNTAACCKKLAGCETYASSDQGVNLCRSRHKEAGSSHKTSAAQCKKTYNACVKGVKSRAGGVKNTEVDGKKISRSTAAEALKADRQACKRRLEACQQGE